MNPPPRKVQLSLDANGDLVIKTTKGTLKKPSGSSPFQLLRYNRRNAARSATESPIDFLVHCAVAKLLKSHQSSFIGKRYVILVTVPDNWTTGTVGNAFKALVKDLGVHTQVHTLERQEKHNWQEVLGGLLKSDRLIVVAPSGLLIDTALDVVVDQKFDLNIGEATYLKKLSRLRKCGSLCDEDIELVRSQHPSLLSSIFRFGCPARTVIDRLPKANTNKYKIQALSLKDNISFGEASTWAAELIIDLEAYRKGELAWREIDTGILLYGPPGTGKTSFARALAKETGLEMIATSMSQWQSAKDGHLGSTLKAIYNSFARAKAASPAILFIDEIDSVGDRDEPNHYKSYHAQVISAILESIDGISDREGVIVVGACNDLNRLDPAIRRSGRLEKHVHFPLPDLGGRLHILRHYFPEFADEMGLHRIARLLVGYSGSDIEKLSRQVRRRGRNESRTCKFDDLVAVAPKPNLPDDALIFRVAMHEAGHALVCKYLDVGTIEHLEVFDFVESFPEEGFSGGHTRLLQPSKPCRTREDLVNFTTFLLAGMAAEEVIFSDKSTSAGGRVGSDIERATRVAVELVTAYGLGNNLSFIAGELEHYEEHRSFQDPTIRQEINAILSKELQRATTILVQHKPLLLALAMRLKTEGKISGKELEAFFDATSFSPAKIQSQKRVRKIR